MRMRWEVAALLLALPGVSGVGWAQLVFRVNPGSLFPAFTRLERSGHIKAKWQPTENNRRA